MDIKMIQMINYSDRAIALTGDTKEYKDELKAAGGSFNARLSCGAGWIFSKKRETELVALVARLNGLGGTDGGKAGDQAGKAPEGAAVYVGTYAKYNAGSLAGKWMRLNDYKDKADFIKACNELHKDEEEPELMFQSWEHVPSWMITESSIDEAVWGYKEPEEPRARQTKTEIEAILKANNIDYPAAKDVAAVVDAGGRLFIFGKQEIKTDFCHPDEPDDEVAAWWKVCKTWEYFRRENMEAFDNEFRAPDLAENAESLTIYRAYRGLNNWRWTDRPEYLWKGTESAPMDAETRRKLAEACKEVRASFEKRLADWWKRYGADRLHCWTYWQDA